METKLTKSKVKKMSKAKVVELGLEYMREGAKKTKPFQGDYFDAPSGDKVVAACALGALYIGATGERKFEKLTTMTIFENRDSGISQLEQRLSDIYLDEYGVMVVDDNDENYNRGMVIRRVAALANKLRK